MSVYRSPPPLPSNPNAIPNASQPPTASQSKKFDFEDDPLVAAGLGLRYYTVAGPIRIDAAFPLNPRDADDSYQIYFSIGQAF